MQVPFLEPERETKELIVGKADVVTKINCWRVVGVGIATILATDARFSAIAASWDAFAKGVDIACLKPTSSRGPPTVIALSSESTVLGLLIFWYGMFGNESPKTRVADREDKITTKRRKGNPLGMIEFPARFE